MKYGNDFLLFLFRPNRFESNRRMNEICEKGNDYQRNNMELANGKLNIFVELKEKNLNEQTILIEKK